MREPIFHQIPKYDGERDFFQVITMDSNNQYYIYSTYDEMSARFLYRKAKAEYDYKVFKPEQVIEEMIKKYGKDSQIDVCIEEMSELTKALVKERRTRLYNRENAFAEASKNDIKEELADVLFMCQYLCQIFDFTAEELSDIIDKKALRTKQRYLGGDK